MLTAILIFAATLALVIWQPRGLGIGWSALGGAAIALLAGVVSLDDVPVVWGIVWDATFTFIALIVISLVLDAAGFFEWAALHVARWGKGYGHWLFLLIVLLTAVVAAIFANDGAVLILTPLVLEMLHALRFRPAAALAFVFAVGFMADAASLPLMISNLTNIIVANYFGISFADYASVMMPVNVLAVLASLAVLWLFFRKDLPSRFEVSALPDPASAIRDPFVFKAGWVVLALLMAGYFAARPLGLPVSAIAGAAALLLVLAALREHFIRQQPNGRGGSMSVEDECGCRHDRSLSPTSPPEGESDEVSLREAPLKAVIPVMTLLREAPWQIVLFSLGMYLVVFGLRNQGLTAELGVILEWLDGQGFWPATLGAGFLFAFLSAMMNNLPAVMVASLAIHDAHLSALTREAMIYANVIGCNLGPKTTPLGSLATLLWLHVLEARGIRIGWGQYCRVGVALTLPVLLATLLGLAAWLMMLR